MKCLVEIKKAVCCFSGGYFEDNFPGFGSDLSIKRAISGDDILLRSGTLS
jgi:hypothetical protein